MSPNAWCQGLLFAGLTVARVFTPDSSVARETAGPPACVVDCTDGCRIIRDDEHGADRIVYREAGGLLRRLREFTGQPAAGGVDVLDRLRDLQTVGLCAPAARPATALCRIRYVHRLSPRGFAYYYRVEAGHRRRAVAAADTGPEILARAARLHELGACPNVLRTLPPSQDEAVSTD